MRPSAAPPTNPYAEATTAPRQTVAAEPRTNHRDNPLAAGVLYPSLGLMPRPEWGALAMSASSITVVSNALLLRREVAPA